MMLQLIVLLIGIPIMFLIFALMFSPPNCNTKFIGQHVWIDDTDYQNYGKRMRHCEVCGINQYGHFFESQGISGPNPDVMWNETK